MLVFLCFFCTFPLSSCDWAQNLNNTDSETRYQIFLRPIPTFFVTKFFETDPFPDFFRYQNLLETETYFGNNFFETGSDTKGKLQKSWESLKLVLRLFFGITLFFRSIPKFFWHQDRFRDFLGINFFWDQFRDFFRYQIFSRSFLIPSK